MNNEYIPPIRILNYHNIVKSGNENPNDFHSISIERLNEHISALTGAGFVQISLSEAFDNLINLRDCKPGFALTFDDGYISLSEFADDIKSPLKPTVFILTEYAGKSTLTWNLRSSVTLMHLSLDEINELDEYGFDIQIHGCDHHNLLKFNDDQLRLRFKTTNDWFTCNLGKTPEYLSYPYGYCDERTKSIASEFYKGAVSVSHGAWSGKAAQYALNRINIPYYLTSADLVRVLQCPPKEYWLEIEKSAPWRKI